MAKKPPPKFDKFGRLRVARRSAWIEPTDDWLERNAGAAAPVVDGGGGGGGGGVTPSGMRFVMPRGAVSGGFIGSASFDTNLTSLMTRTYTFATPNTVQLLYYNGAMGDVSLTGELPNANDIILRAFAETSAGAAKGQFPFAGSLSPYRLAPGQFILTDPITVGWAANTIYAVKTETAVDTIGQTWPSNFNGGSTVSGRADQTYTMSAADAGDQVIASGPLNIMGGVSNIGGHIPVAIVGNYVGGFGSTAKPSVLFCGDSIASGQNSNTFNFGTTNGGGFLFRACRGLGSPFTAYAKAGTRGDQYATGVATILKELMKYASVTIWEFSTNEFGNVVTPAQLLTATQTIKGFAMAAQPACDFVQLRTTPRAGSTNGFIDTSHQTPNTNFSTGEFPDQFLALCQGAGISTLDAMSVIADATFPDRWLANASPNYGTNDGLHPNDVYHILMQTPVQDYLASKTFK